MPDEFEERKRKVLAPVFFEAGAALYDCQAFEYAVAYLLFLFSRLGPSELNPARCVAILEDEEKRTAGQLIHLLKKHLRISEGLEAGLVHALAARNRLVHRYLIDNAERLAEVKEHGALVQEIKTLRSAVRRGQKRLDPFVRALAAMLNNPPFDAWQADTREKFLRDTKEH